MAPRRCGIHSKPIFNVEKLVFHSFWNLSMRMHAVRSQNIFFFFFPFGYSQIKGESIDTYPLGLFGVATYFYITKNKKNYKKEYKISE